MGLIEQMQAEGLGVADLMKSKGKMREEDEGSEE